MSDSERRTEGYIISHDEVSGRGVDAPPQLKHTSQGLVSEHWRQLERVGEGTLDRRIGLGQLTGVAQAAIAYGYNFRRIEEERADDSDSTVPIANEFLLPEMFKVEPGALALDVDQPDFATDIQDADDPNGTAKGVDQFIAANRGDN